MELNEGMPRIEQNDLKPFAIAELECWGCSGAGCAFKTRASLDGIPVTLCSDMIETRIVLERALSRRTDTR